MDSFEKNYTLEKENLERVIITIKKELLNIIKKRKAISAQIIDYREKAIEEFRDDEDKLVEYFDHERYVKEESFSSLDRRLKELTKLEYSPYFGRVDFIEDKYAEKIYIGRFGLIPEGTFEPEIIDWRAPIASLFYAGKLGRVSYSAPNEEVTVDILQKRQFVIKNSELVGLFDTAVDIKDDILQMVLSKNAGDKLKDIIMTIQAEQDRLIRAPKEKTIIVDGAAGSGKTTVALHRVAYLLYNYRKSFKDSVLILGPNEIFMEYISSVLPSLGETGVMQQTYRDFAMELADINNIMDSKDYMEKIFNKDEEFIEQIKVKNSYEYINKLEKAIEDLEHNYFEMKDIIFRDRVILNKNETYELFNKYYSAMPLFRRSNKIKRIIFSKLKDVRDELVRNINIEIREKKNKMTKEQLEIHENSIDFGRKLKIREVIKDMIIIKKSISSWLSGKSVIEIYNEFNNHRELTVDDLSPILFLKIKLEGLKVKNRIKHIVIDEAQDYSPLTFMVIKELTDCISMTVVGDSNQRIIPLYDRVEMFNIERYVKKLDIENYKLTKSYRSTTQIINYANQFLKDYKETTLVREGSEVVERYIRNEQELLQNIIESLNRFKDSGYESIAVICRNIVETETIGKLLKEKTYINIIDNESIVYKSGVVIVPSYFAKGMEFDAVVVVTKNDSVVTNEQNTDKLLYVMCTRALHELHVYKY